MTDLVACLGAGKGTWSYMKNLIQSESWGAVFLVTNEFGKDNFSSPKKETRFIIINETLPLPETIKLIKSQLEKNISGTEVALNIVSGSGAVHMAMISALLKLGLGIRLVALTNEGVREV
jgi:hypothetical protein